MIHGLTAETPTLLYIYFSLRELQAPRSFSADGIYIAAFPFIYSGQFIVLLSNNFTGD